MNWISVDSELPPTGKVVLTKIDDSGGERNEQKLLFDGLWFFPDRSMYVYYKPTHWKLLPEQEMLKEIDIAVGEL